MNDQQQSRADALTSMFAAHPELQDDRAVFSAAQVRAMLREVRATSANETGAEGATWYDRWQAECTRDHGEYDENAPIADRLRWWVPKSARHGTILLEDDLREASDKLSRSPAMAAAAPAEEHSTIECQAHSGPDCTECGGTGAWSGSADERAANRNAQLAHRWEILAEAIEGSSGRTELDLLIRILDECAAKAAVAEDILKPFLRASSPAAAPTDERAALIRTMVDRFLGWKLPRDFAPDAGISFVPPANPDWWPTGTNLFTADQATQLFEHVFPEAARAAASTAAERVIAALQALSADVHTLGDGWANDEAMIGLAKKYLRVEPKPASPELSLWRDFVLLAVTDAAPQPAQTSPAAMTSDMPNPVWWINYGNHGQISTRPDEADRARESGAKVYEYRAASPAAEAVAIVTEQMLTRFLGWRLPIDFAPDAGISFKPPTNPDWWPVGTNLLTAPQARQMLEHVLSIAPQPAQADAPAEARELTSKLLLDAGAILKTAERFGLPLSENTHQFVREILSHPELKISASAVSAEAREPHFDDVAVDWFSAVMKHKLALARAKGRSGWETCSPADLSRMLREHVEKGDPRDVANFCMMLWHHGSPIVSAPADAAEAREAVANYVMPPVTLLEQQKRTIAERHFKGAPDVCRALQCIDDACVEMLSRAPADAGEAIPIAIYQVECGIQQGQVTYRDADKSEYDERQPSSRRIVYTAPAASRMARLTDEQRESIEHAATWLGRSEDLQNKAHAKRLRALLNGADR